MKISTDVLNYGLLSELAYLKLENFGGNYTLDENELKLFMNNESRSGVKPDRLSAMKELIDTYTIVDFTTTPSGMQAMLLRGSGGYTVAFRGTETGEWSELKKDFGSDAEMAIGHEIQQMRDALAYVQMLQTTGVKDHSNNDAIVKINASTVLTGHSLGGALAQYVSFKTGYEAYTYNGFGIRKGEGIIGAGGDTSRIHNFHLGVDFVSGIGSRIGGQPGGQVFETTRDVLAMIPYPAISRTSQALISLGALLTAANINATIDNITGSFLGSVTNITPYDSSSLGDYGQDHLMTEMNKALHLYQTYLSPIFGSDKIETINLEMASIAALPYEYIAQSPYRVLSTNGMPKVLELMGYALLDKPMSNGSRYDTYANTEAFLTQLKNAVTANGGIEVLAFDFDTPDALFNAAIGSKPLQYALVNNLPLIVYKNASASIYAEFDGSYMSHTQLKDIASMAYYMEHPKAGQGIGTVYENKETDVIVYDKEAAIDRVIFGKNDQNEEETLQGLSGDDRLYGNGGDDTLIGDSESGYLTEGDDWLEGGAGADILKGGGGDDWLIGGYAIDKVDDRGDYMMGGSGDDMYYSGNFDIIKDDTTGEGRVYFEGKLLTGGTKKAGAGCGPTEDDGSSEYYGDGGVYRLSGNLLTFEKDGKILTIEDYSNGQLDITLDDNPGDGGSCPSTGPGEGGGGSCPKPVNPLFNFNFSLPSPTRSVSSGGGSGGTYYGGGGGGGGGSVTHTSTPSTPHRTPTPPAPELPCPNLPTHHSAGKGGGGGGTPPIVLDLNRNGITSISLAASIALFDYDGDSVLENTAWIENSDALLVNDVNQDGLINSASELFGNYTRNSDGSVAKSGYQALSYYDTNGDSVVDASDSRFEELKLWIDSNGDGITDTGELKTLTEMGVTSLKLNDPTTPYIPTTEKEVNGEARETTLGYTNTIIQETTFTDANGEGVMRDVLFRYENNSTNTEGVYFDMDGNGIQEKMLTWTDPNEWMVVKDINGDGLITSGREVVGNNMILSNGTKAADTIQALKLNPYFKIQKKAA